MAAKPKSKPLKPSDAYQSAIARLFRMLDDPEAQARAKAKREAQERPERERKARENQRMIEHFHAISAREIERWEAETQRIEAEVARLTEERGPGVLFPCSRCGDFCTILDIPCEPRRLYETQD